MKIFQNTCAHTQFNEHKQYTSLHTLRLMSDFIIYIRNTYNNLKVYLQRKEKKIFKLCVEKKYFLIFPTFLHRTLVKISLYISYVTLTLFFN